MKDPHTPENKPEANGLVGHEAGGDGRRYAPAAARNRDPLWAVLGPRLPSYGRVLEIASGTGEHVTAFAAQRPDLTWLPSDPDADMRASIDAHVAARELFNVPPAMDLDVTWWPWNVKPVDAVVCINMLHISPWNATESLLAGTAEVLNTGGRLFIYGPFKRAGYHVSESNARFDASLRARDRHWGVRDIDDVTAVAQEHNLALEDVVEMPANNQTLIFRCHD